MPPRVSICIPSYNHGSYLGLSIKSALEQTIRDLEVIVLDDGSSDNSLDICKGIADSRFRWSQNEQRLGLSGNFNACLEAALGEYVLILCDDDLLEPFAVELMATALDRNPDAVFAVCRRRVLSTKGVAQDLISALPVGIVPGDLVVRISALCFNIIGEPSAVLIRRSALCGGQFFDVRMQQMVDWEFWLRLLALGPLLSLGDVGATYREHPEAMSSKNRLTGRVVSDLLVLCNSIEEDPATYPPVHASRIRIARLLCFLRSCKGMFEGALLRRPDVVLTYCRLASKSFGALMLPNRVERRKG